MFAGCLFLWVWQAIVDYSNSTLIWCDIALISYLCWIPHEGLISLYPTRETWWNVPVRDHENIKETVLDIVQAQSQVRFSHLKWHDQNKKKHQLMSQLQSLSPLICGVRVVILDTFRWKRKHLTLLRAHSSFAYVIEPNTTLSVPYDEWKKESNERRHQIIKFPINWQQTCSLDKGREEGQESGLI